MLKWQAYTLSAAGVAAAVGLGYASTSGIGPIGGPGVDMISMLKARSPGERATGAQTNKRVAMSAPAAVARPAAAPARPISRVLSAAVPAPVTATPSLAAAPVPLVAAPAAAPAALAAAPLLAAAPVGAGLSPLAGLGLLPVIPAVIGGGGGGSPVAVTPPAPAVPEPGTWLMMIVGFGMLGMALRRRSARLSRDPDAFGTARAAASAA